MVDGKTVRGRKQRFGVINIEDENHCDFVYLRNFLTRTHLYDLMETTTFTHYESYRTKQLMALKENSAAASAHGSGSRPISPGPLAMDRGLDSRGGGNNRTTMNGY